MKRARLLMMSAVGAAGLFMLSLFESADALLPKPPQSSIQAPANAPVVYVSDFELDVYHNWLMMRPSQRSAGSASSAPSSKPAAGSAEQSAGASSSPGQGTPSASPQSSAGSTPGQPQQDSTRLDPDAELRSRANALINVVAQNVVRALRESGYEAHRLRGNRPRPENGLLIRGVFAESDEQNRARRLLFGGPSTSPKMILYVGVNNLKNPDQPLYELANPPAPDSRYGPVITVTSYSPAVRFELAKKPSDDEIADVAGQIAADLTKLLAANPLMSTQ